MEPMADKEIETLREEMEDQREEIREYLAIEGVDTSAWDDSEGATEAGADSGK